MGSHVYEFAGRFYLQTLGGPIGLAITAWLASIVMKCFDNLWLRLAQKCNIDISCYIRYVDDSRNFLKGIKPGWKWVKNGLKFDEIWLFEDLTNGIPEDSRIMNIVLDAMNSVMPFLTFTGETLSDFTNKRLPTLDCEIFVVEGQIFHSFYEKSMRSGKSLDSRTALPEITVRASLRQEIIRRLINMHLDLSVNEKIAFL